MKAKAQYRFTLDDKGQTFHSNKYIDWEERRFELVKQLLPTMATQTWNNGILGSEEQCAKWALQYANAMIDTLQKDIEKNEFDPFFYE